MAAPIEGEGSRARAGGGGVYYTFGGTGGGGSSGGAGRPWGELVDRAAFGKPDSTRDAFSRIKKNLSYFRRNYAIVMLVIVGLALLWHPISLIVLAVLTAAWIYLYFSRSGPLVLFSRSFGENLVLAILIVVTIVALAFTPNAGIPLLVSLLVGLAIVLIHATFRSPDNLFLDEQEHAALLGKRGGVAGSAHV